MEQLFSHLSPATRKHRIYTLKRIGLTDPNDYSVLLDMNKIKSIINHGSVNTQKTNGMHILAFLKAVGNKELMNQYYNMLKNTFDEAAKLETNGKTKKSDSYMTLSELQSKLLEHKPKIITIKAFEKLQHKIHYMNQLQDYILLSLYVLNPPIRNDYARVKIITNLQDKKDIEANGNENFLFIGTKEIKFHLNDFKNLKTMGPIVITYDKETNKLIRLYYKMLKILKAESLNDNEMQLYFINSITRKINPLSESTLSTKIIQLSNKYFEHNYSINDFRHIWENAIQSDPQYMNLSVTKRENLHRQLLHSTATAMNYKIIN